MEFVLAVHVTLVKSKEFQKLDGMNIIIQRKVQNHQDILDATSTTLHGLDCQIKCSIKFKDQVELKSMIYCSLET